MHPPVGHSSGGGGLAGYWLFSLRRCHPFESPNQICSSGGCIHLTLTDAGSICLSVYNTQSCVIFNFVTFMPTFPNLVAMDCLKNNNSTPDVGVLLRLMMRQSV